MAKIKQSVKKTGKARKEIIVAELVEKFDNSNGLVFTDYKGITHQQLENLKKELKALDSTIIIAKNSLIKISMEKSKKYGDFKENEGLNLPTATLIINGDMVEPLKKLQKTVKDLGLPKIKFAILEGNLTDESGVLKIASLPNRETLIAQFIGTLNSPIQGLVMTLNGTIQKFVMTLDAVASVKQNSTPQAPEPTPTEAVTAAPDAENPSEQKESPITTDESEDPSKTTSEQENSSEEEQTPTEENKGGEN